VTQQTLPGQALPVRVPGKPGPHRLDRLLIVDDPTAGEVAVRWTLAYDVPLWRCKACGPQPAANCVHTFSAAIRLSTDILGLNPVVNINEGTNQ